MISSTFTNSVIVIFNKNSGLNNISRFNENIAFEYHIIWKPIKITGLSSSQSDKAPFIKARLNINNYD